MGLTLMKLALGVEHGRLNETMLRLMDLRERVRHVIRRLSSIRSCLHASLCLTYLRLLHVRLWLWRGSSRVHVVLRLLVDLRSKGLRRRGGLPLLLEGVIAVVKLRLAVVHMLWLICILIKWPGRRSWS